MKRAIRRLQQNQDDVILAVIAILGLSFVAFVIYGLAIHGNF